MAWTLADITARIQGRILYFGDPSRTWSLAQFDTAFAQVKTWGFDGVAPKLSDGQGTDYATDADLRAIIAKAKVHGLSCWPWVGVTKGTPQRWADICSEMAHASGLAFIDVEAPADFHAFMAEYRVKTPENLPVLCTCAGDPVTFSSGWPGPTAVQEGVVFSLQFYFSSWKAGYCSGLPPDQCINKADAEWIRVAGPSVILVPSLNFAGLSAAEVTALATYAARWKSPVLWWHYGVMTPAYAAAIMAAPVGFPVSSAPDPCADVKAQLAQTQTQLADALDRLRQIGTLAQGTVK